MSGNRGGDGGGDAAGGGGGGPGGFLSGFDCGDSWSRMGLVTRFVLVEGLLGVILGAVGLGVYTICCASPIVSSYGLQFYRLLVSWAVSRGLLSGLFSVLTLWQLARNMEESRGSFWFGATILQISIATNLVILLLGLLFGSLMGVTFFLTSVCAAGLWPACFGLMAIDCMATPEEQRRILCFPCELASKFYPLLMLALFTLLMGGPDAGMVLGLGLGYALHYRPGLQLSLTTATRWEAKPKLAFVVERDGFRRASDSGVQAMGGGGAWGSGGGAAAVAGGGGAPPSRFGTVHGASAAPSAGAPAPVASSVFSGTGHRLGGPMPPAAHASSSSSLLSFSNPFSSGGSAPSAATGTGAGASSAAPSDPAALEAARKQRAAAFDKRASKPSNAAHMSTWIPKQPQQPQPSSAGSTSSNSLGNASGTRSGLASPSAPAAAPSSSADLSGAGSSASSLHRPPSPSGLGVFSLGLDDADPDADQLELELEGDEDDDLEQQQHAHAQRAQSSGFALSGGGGGGGGRGKEGYAAVDISGEEEDEEGSSLAPQSSVDPDDNATESTSLHTQR